MVAIPTALMSMVTISPVKVELSHDLEISKMVVSPIREQRRVVVEDVGDRSLPSLL